MVPVLLCADAHVHHSSSHSQSCSLSWFCLTSLTAQKWVLLKIRLSTYISVFLKIK